MSGRRTSRLPFVSTADGVSLDVQVLMSLMGVLWRGMGLWSVDNPLRGIPRGLGGPWGVGGSRAEVYC